MDVSFHQVLNIWTQKTTESVEAFWTFWRHHWDLTFNFRSPLRGTLFPGPILQAFECRRANPWTANRDKTLVLWSRQHAELTKLKEKDCRSRAANCQTNMFVFSQPLTDTYLPERQGPTQSQDISVCPVSPAIHYRDRRVSSDEEKSSDFHQSLAASHLGSWGVSCKREDRQLLSSLGEDRPLPTDQLLHSLIWQSVLFFLKDAVDCVCLVWKRSIFVQYSPRGRCLLGLGKL